MAYVYTDGSTPQLRLIDQVFVAYSTRDMNNVAPFLSEDFKFSSHPKMAEQPEQTKQNHIDLYGPLFAGLAKMDYAFHEVIDAPGKVVIQGTAFCTSPDGAKLEYDSLSILTLVEEGGELKIVEFKDFADPEKRLNFHKTMAQLLQQGQIS